MIASLSVVNKDIAEKGIYAGNPAKLKESLWQNPHSQYKLIQ